MGHALSAGRSGRIKLGRQKRVRRFFVIHEHGDRGHKIFGLVGLNLTVANRFAALRGDPKSTRGFTMIEMMFVIFIILVLIAMAGGRYEKSVIRAREAVLKQDLQTMRNAIQQYTLDKAAGPQSLD